MRATSAKGTCSRASFSILEPVGLHDPDKGQVAQKCGLIPLAPVGMKGMVLEGPIGERIRIYRLRRGLSQRELAGLVQRSESWLSQVERGIRSVDKLSVLIDIAKVLRVKVETLSGHPMALAPNGGPELDGIAAI